MKKLMLSVLIVAATVVIGIGTYHHAPGHNPTILGVSAPIPVSTPDPAVLTCAQGNSNVTDIIRLTNDERIKAGLPALVEDPRLDKSALMKANDEVTNNYWGHVSPSGVTPWYWFKQNSYIYRYAGENLAKGFYTSDGVIAGWMNSPSHRANILGAHFEDIGVAEVCGTLLNNQTHLIVAHYGS